MAAQVWTVAMSPAERWVLATIMLNPAVKLKTALDKGRHRRARDAFGVGHIVAALKRNGNKISTAKANDETMLLHKITVENADYALKLIDEIEATGEQAVILDIVAERLRAAKDGTYEPPGAPDWDPVLDTGWDPVLTPKGEKPDGAITCPSCGQYFERDETES